MHVNGTRIFTYTSTDGMDELGLITEIGDVLYFVKKVTPECANPVRELTVTQRDPGIW